MGVFAQVAVDAVTGVRVVAEFVEYQLDDGSTVLFESAESDLVALHGGDAEVRSGGRLGDRLSSIAKAAAQIASAMRESVGPDELSLELGVKVAGEVNAWFFAKQQAEATVKVTLTWKKGASTAAADRHEDDDRVSLGDEGDDADQGVGR